MVRSLAVVAMLCGSVAIVDAAPAKPCYRPAEIEAEQAVRFQTELMVLSDTCGRSSYVHFRQRNGELLADYQHRLVERFRRLLGGRAESAFDRYITGLANTVSLDLGREPVATLCSRSEDFLAHADGLGNSEFRRMVADQAAARTRDYRRCTD